MKTCSSVIFIAYQPITLKFKKDFYIEKLSEEGFKIEYWDLSKLFKRNTHANVDVTGIKQYEISNWYQLKKCISQYCSQSLFVFDITYYGRVYKLFKLFSKFNCKTAVFGRGTLPYPSSNYSFVKKFFFRFKAFKNLKYIEETFLNQKAIAAKRFNLIKPYTYIFYAGNAGVSNIGNGYKFGLEKSKLVAVNSFDYDAYLLLKGSGDDTINRPYCVFLDSYLPYHPDFKLLGLPQLNAKNYYTALNNFFKLIEDRFKVEVVIAAHPKSKYEENNTFNNRMVIKNKTAELVKYARFVISHVSTSISFAILFKKPLLFVYTNEIKKIYPFTHYQLVLHFSKLLNTPCINIDEAPGNFNVIPIDEKAYNDYKYNYLTSHLSERQLSEDIFINFLKREARFN